MVSKFKLLSLFFCYVNAATIKLAEFGLEAEKISNFSLNVSEITGIHNFSNLIIKYPEEIRNFTLTPKFVKNYIQGEKIESYYFLSNDITGVQKLSSNIKVSGEELLTSFYYTEGKLKWKIAGDMTQAAISKDGTIYVADVKLNYLYAINPNGSFKWKYYLENIQVYFAPVVSYDGTIYISSSKFLYAISPNATLKCFCNISGGITASPVISNDGTIYFGSDDNLLYAFDLDCKLKSKFLYFQKPIYQYLSMGTDSRIYLTAGCGPSGGIEELYAIRRTDGSFYDGAIYWKYNANSPICFSTAIDSDGNVYFGANDYLYSIDLRGNLRWKYLTNGSCTSPSISNKGDIYFSSYDKYVYALDNSGNLKWKYFINEVGLSSAIDNDGTIYILGENLFAISKDGLLKWKYSVGSPNLLSSTLIAKDGTIYVSSSYRGYLYAISSKSFYLNAPWPLVRQDNFNRGLQVRSVPQLKLFDFRFFTVNWIPKEKTKLYLDFALVDNTDLIMNINIVNTVTPTLTLSKNELKNLLQTPTSITKPIILPSVNKIINYIPDQIIDLNEIYRYSLTVKELFAGSASLLTINEKKLPDWLYNKNLNIVPTEGISISLVVSNNLAYVASYSSGLQIINVTDPENATTIAYVPTTGAAQDIALQNNIAYVAAGASGLQVINVTDPDNSYTISYIKLDGGAVGVILKNSIAYIASYNTGLKILNISNSENITLISKIDNPKKTSIFFDIPKDLSIVYVYPKNAILRFTLQNFILYALSGEGLYIINVSDPINPIIITYVTTTDYTVGVVLKNSLVYVACINGLRIINTTYPNKFNEIARVATTGKIYGFAIENGVAYLAAGQSGLQIINIADPSNAFTVEYIETQSLAWGVIVEKNLAYVALWLGGLEIIYVGNIDDIHKIASIPTTLWYNRNTFTLVNFVNTNNLFFLSDGIIYIAAYYNGLQIINLQETLLLAPSQKQKYLRYGDLASLEIKIVDNNGNVYTDDFNIIVDQLPIFNCNLEKQKIFPKYSMLIPINLKVLFTFRGELLRPSLENTDKKWINFAMETKLIAQFVYREFSINYIDVDINKSIIYAASNAGLLILQIENDNSLFLLNSYLGPKVNKVKYKDDKLIFSTNSEVYISNVANIQYPLIYNFGFIDSFAIINDKILINNRVNSLVVKLDPYIKHIASLGQIFAIAVQDVFIYVLSLLAKVEAYLQIIDVSNPKYPYTIIYVPMNYSEPCSLLVKGNYAYITGNTGLQIIDISNPERAYCIRYVSTQYFAYDIVIKGSIAYVAAGDGGLQIIDISNLKEAYTITYKPINGSANSIAIQDNLIYLGVFSKGLEIFEIHNQSNVVKLNTILIEGFSSFVLKDFFAYVFLYDSDDIKIFNFKNFTNIVFLSNIKTNGNIRNIVVEQPMLYALESYNGLRGDLEYFLNIINISDYNFPNIIVKIPIFQGPKGLAIKDGIAYVGTFFSNQDAPYQYPVQVIQLPLYNEMICNDIVSINENVGLCFSNKNLNLFNIQNMNIEILNTYEIAFIKKFELFDNNIIIAKDFYLQILDLDKIVSKDSSYYFITFYKSSSIINDFSISKSLNQIFLATNNGLEVLNISNLSNPVMIGAHTTFTPSVSVKLHNYVALLAAGTQGILLLNYIDNWNIYGVPDISEIGNHNITLTVIDMLGAKVSANISILVMGPPILVKTISNQLAFEDKLFDFTIPLDIFEEPNNNTIYYSTKLISSDRDELPGWIKFDNSIGRFYGIPSEIDVNFYEDKILSINLTCMNLGPIGTSTIFNINVRGKIIGTPIVHKSISTQQAYEGTLFDFTIPSDIFVEPNNNSMYYIARLVSDYEQLPNWLKFDENKARFSGQPAKDDLKFWGTKVLNINLTAMNAGPIGTSTIFQIEVKGITYGDITLMVNILGISFLTACFYTYKKKEILKYYYQETFRLNNEPWDFHVCPKSTNIEIPFRLLKVKEGDKDYTNAEKFYKSKKMPGYKIKEVDVIYSPMLQQAFEENVKLLDARSKTEAIKVYLAPNKYGIEKVEPKKSEQTIVPIIIYNEYKKITTIIMSIEKNKGIFFNSKYAGIPSDHLLKKINIKKTEQKYFKRFVEEYVDKEQSFESRDAEEVYLTVNDPVIAFMESKGGKINKEQLTVFEPKFSTEENDPERKELRKQVRDKWEKECSNYHSKKYPKIKLLPAWHATSVEVANSVFRTGFVNLAKRDEGFYGKGIYFTLEAEYAYGTYGKRKIKPTISKMLDLAEKLQDDTYSKTLDNKKQELMELDEQKEEKVLDARLILSWVASYSAYPVIDGDKQILEGKGNYQNYDSHFVPVAPNKEGDNKNYPCKYGEIHKYHEIVAFTPSQCLPRYLLTLEKEEEINLASPKKVEHGLIRSNLISPKHEEDKKLMAPFFSAGTVQSDSIAKDCQTGKNIASSSNSPTTGNVLFVDGKKLFKIKDENSSSNIIDMEVLSPTNRKSSSKLLSP